MASDFEATQPNSQHLQSIPFGTYSVSISLNSPQTSISPQLYIELVKKIEILEQKVGHFNAQSLNCEKRVQNVEERQEDLEAGVNRELASARDVNQELWWQLQTNHDYINHD